MLLQNKRMRSIHHLGIILLLTLPVSCGMDRADIIDDKKTGLQWTNKISDEELVWEEARKYCSNLVVNGKDDWRLPTVTELMTTINPEMVNDDPNSATRPFHGPFIIEKDGYLFSGTSAGGEKDAVYLMNLRNADVSNGKGNKAYVRCVRDTRFKLSLFSRPEAVFQSKTPR